MERRVGASYYILKSRPSLLMQFLPCLTEQPAPPCSWMLKALSFGIYFEMLITGSNDLDVESN